MSKNELKLERVIVSGTMDYDTFHFIRGNRVIRPGHVSRLVASISEINLLPWNPITVNEDLQILDGQHRLLAAKKLGLPIYYIVMPFGGLREVQMYNTNKSNWTMEDFLESHITQGNSEYKYLKEFAIKYNLTYSNALRLLAGDLKGHSSKKHGVVSQFRAGNFKATQKEAAQKFAQQINELNDFMEEGVRNDRDFLTALDKTYTTVSHKDLLAKLTDSGWKIRQNGSVRGYLRNLEEIVNYRSKSARVRLF